MQFNVTPAMNKDVACKATALSIDGLERGTGWEGTISGHTETALPSVFPVFKDENDVDSTLATPMVPKAGPAMTRERETLTQARPGPWTLKVTSGEDVRKVRPWICGASLMALRKPNGPLRPVAVGETLRRLCSKVAVELVGSSVRTILEPVQVEVQTRARCEAVVHTTRQWTKTLRDDPDQVLVLIDLANAFNCVSRWAVLSAVRKHFAWMSPWADMCYRHDSNLVAGSLLIHSQRGVQ